MNNFSFDLLKGLMKFDVKIIDFFLDLYKSTPFNVNHLNFPTSGTNTNDIKMYSTAIGNTLW